MGGTKPTRVFKYPGGTRMCAHGKVRAAVWGNQILTEGEEAAAEIEAKARKGEHALLRHADTNKANLIAHIVFSLFRLGRLEEYVNPEGDFLREDGKVTNLAEHESIAKRFKKNKEG